MRFTRSAPCRRRAKQGLQLGALSLPAIALCTFFLQSQATPWDESPADVQRAGAGGLLVRLPPEQGDENEVDKRAAGRVIYQEQPWVGQAMEHAAGEGHRELRMQRGQGAGEGSVASLQPSSDAVSPQAAQQRLELEGRGRMRRLISMSIYGNDSRYTVGALENAALVASDWPGWTLRIYYHVQSVPEDLLAQLRALPAVELVPVDYRGGGHAGRMWRFLALEDPTATRVIVRDIDARLTERDRRAVEEWVASGRFFHVMHDHPAHEAPVMAGLWGAVGGFVRPGVFEGWHRGDAAARELDAGEDQAWLAERVWPAARGWALAHASYRCGGFGEREWRGFPTQRATVDDFVGNVFQEDNSFLGYQLWEGCPVECRRRPEWTAC